MTVGYSMIGDSEDISDAKYQRYHDLMKIFAKQNHLDFQKDVRPITAGKQKHMFDYINDNLNQTKYMVAFCHDEWYEELEVTTVGDSENMFNFTQSVEERSKGKTEKF